MQAEGQPARRLVVAEGLLGTLREKLACSLTPLATLSGGALEGCAYQHPLAGLGGVLDRESPVVIGGDYITTDAGTGLVHTAPGHGVEDYQVSPLWGCKLDWDACSSVHLVPVHSPELGGGLDRERLA